MPKITISYSRARESDAQMQASLDKAVESQKGKWDIKLKEAQSMQVKRYKNPEPPENPQEAKAMQMLITRGPMRSDELVPLLDLIGLNKDEAAVLILHKLVDAGKATRSVDERGVHYALKQVEEDADSPYKGKKLKAWGKPVVTKSIREDGQEVWTTTVEGDCD